MTIAMSKGSIGNVTRLRTERPFILSNVCPRSERLTLLMLQVTGGATHGTIFEYFHSLLYFLLLCIYRLPQSLNGLFRFVILDIIFIL